MRLQASLFILCVFSATATAQTPLAEIEASDATKLLRLNDDGGFLVKGAFDTGIIPTSGAGTRLMWYPGKAAFRAGRAKGTEWDDRNIGDYSTAMGSFTTASGFSSTAMGGATAAFGSVSTAMGNQTVASGNNSTAMGFWTSAQAYSSLVIGRFNVISGTTDSWEETEPLFVAGNGSDGISRANALTLLKNGQLGLGTETPSENVHVLDPSGSSAIFLGGQGTVGPHGLVFEDETLGEGLQLFYRTGPNRLILEKSSVGTGTNGTDAFFYDRDDDNFYFGGNVGIGTTDPKARLDIDGALAARNASIDGSFVAEGEYLVGRIPTSGAGTRLMWYPKKAAFRAGRVIGTEWNDLNIGDYSTAVGNQTVASGSASSATGEGTTASGDHSTAMGQDTEASGTHSTALGRSTEASGTYSTALGVSTEATGDGSTAMGGLTTATGAYSTAMGRFSTAHAYGSLVIGRFNVISGISVSWNGTDPLFVAGNGTPSTPSNALTLLKNGYLGLNTSLPAFPLVVGTNSTNGNGAHVTAGGTWTNGSSRRFKKAFRAVDADEVLARVAALPVLRWRYLGGQGEGEHMGPMAEEFHAAFGLGSDERYIATVDADGVALAAIQALTRRLEAQEAENKRQRDEIEVQRSEIAQLENRLARLENLLTSTAER